MNIAQSRIIKLRPKSSEFKKVENVIIIMGKTWNIQEDALPSKKRK